MPTRTASEKWRRQIRLHLLLFLGLWLYMISPVLYPPDTVNWVFFMTTFLIGFLYLKVFAVYLLIRIAINSFLFSEDPRQHDFSEEEAPETLGVRSMTPWNILFSLGIVFGAFAIPFVDTMNFHSSDVEPCAPSLMMRGLFILFTILVTLDW